MVAIGCYEHVSCLDYRASFDTSNIDHTHDFSSTCQKCASNGTYFAKASVQNWLQLTKVNMCLLIC